MCLKNTMCISIDNTRIHLKESFIENLYNDTIIIDVKGNLLKVNIETGRISTFEWCKIKDLDKDFLLYEDNVAWIIEKTMFIPLKVYKIPSISEMLLTMSEVI